MAYRPPHSFKDGFRTFGVYLTDRLYRFVQEKGLLEEFWVWNKQQNEQHDKERALIAEKEMEDRYWRWKEEQVRAGKDSSPGVFLEGLKSENI